MSEVNGLNNLKASGGPDKLNINALAESPSRFDPSAQVNPAKDGIAARVRLQSDQANPNRTNPDHPIELEVATLGSIRITRKQLEDFKARVAEGLNRQEEAINLAAKTFGANNPILEDAIYSALAA
jgi:hypothetical protein